MVEWSEVRADRIIQLSQSALLRIVHLPDQVGLERRFKGVPAQRPHTLGVVDLLAGDRLKAVNTYHTDPATMVTSQQKAFSSVFTGVAAGSAEDKNGIAPVPLAGG